MLRDNNIDEGLLEQTFCIVEETGNICPTLTPRVESALLVKVDNGGTESMQQHGLDVFLMGVIGTARDHLPVDVAIDRNASEASMTKQVNRPDYLCSINGQLVFKGEEKKRGDVRTIARELIDKMLPGVVGKNGRLAYLFGYATAGTRVLFECIYDDMKMHECSDILDLAKLRDRITMIMILVNIIRISRAMLDK
ncbi:hypothetical protein DL89DRAFT_294100 [Linderina pennispora]|uniref:Uncharacterized protein n=1 Tax=Linderina pennispora TaxID=61395 RepID=A0A1Y1W3X9_9FUNG|nr:uncharacterized protein DL89DRAFT_294100 [Linderina pennispora]ORX68167.1 hypothetical protein DL89DRAFT_294100 [Linderina pennispora]